MDGYKEVIKKAKVIMGSTPEEIESKASQFEAEHNVVEIKQHHWNFMVIFYLEPKE